MDIRLHLNVQLQVTFSVVSKVRTQYQACNRLADKRTYTVPDNHLSRKHSRLFHEQGLSHYRKGYVASSLLQVSYYRQYWAIRCVCSMRAGMRALELSLMSCCIHSTAVSSSTSSRSFSCSEHAPTHGQCVLDFSFCLLLFEDDQGLSGAPN